MIKITLPDNSIKEFEKPINGFEIAKSISENLMRNCIAIKIDNQIFDMSEPILKNSKIELITNKSTITSLDILRHTTSHIFAQALFKIYNSARITIGPSIEDGFYYDVDCAELTENDFPKIEKEMQNIINQNLEITKSIKSFRDAKKFYYDNKYKQEIISAIENGTLNEEENKEGNSNNKNKELTFYSQGTFTDLCAGPHLPSTGFVKAFKLIKITKCYFRGNPNNTQLKRVYGTAFFKKKELTDYFQMLEEAKKRDHRILGKQLKLFMTNELSPGSTFFLEKGYFIYKKLQDFIREIYEKQNYQEVKTPNMFNKKLWEISGHWEHYKEDMFLFKIGNEDFSLKPMNCPSHCLIFKNEIRSHKNLPLRIADFGALHRNEASGALSGLTRVRKFCQDDAHIFCKNSDIENEIKKLLETIEEVYVKTFGMNYEIELSTRPKKFLGDIEIWNKAEESLENALKNNNREFKICKEDGAFYGPKIDFRIRDCINRVWQTATIQLDFNLPKRFELEFVNENNETEKPVMIHRAILGSLERFIGIIIEQFEGKFPLWISPNQIMILNVSDKHQEKCLELQKKFKENKIRCDINFDNETISNKIRLSQKEKYNYILVIGDNELNSNEIIARTRKFDGKRNEELKMDLEKFIQLIKKQIEEKEINY
jgi:threonyl-tRNA synthetase